MQASDTVTRLTKHRRSQAYRDLIDYVMGQNEPLGQQLKHCASWLLIRQWIETGASRVLKAHFCKNFLLCPACAVRRSWKLQQAYEAKGLAVQQLSPELIPAMVTLTILNGEDLLERFLHFKAAWSRMMAAKRGAFNSTRGHNLIEWNKVDGGLRAIEVTNTGKGWHVHSHNFTLLHESIDKFKLSAEWNRFTGDSEIVHIRPCPDGIREGLVETIKYVSKMADLSPAQAYYVHKTFSGNRCTDSFGSLRGVRHPDIDSDEIKEGDLELVGPFIDYVVRWQFEQQRFSAPVTAAEEFCESAATVAAATRALTAASLATINVPLHDPLPF